MSVFQTDRDGNFSFTSVPFTSDSGAPSIAIDGVSGVSNRSGGHVVSGSVSLDGANRTITVSDGSVVLGSTTADAQGHFSFAFTDTKDGGVHGYSLTAATTNAAGNTGTSDVFAFDFDYTSNRDLFGTVAHDASGHAGQVYALYEGLLGRAPEDVGFRGWTDSLDHGASLQSVTQGILFSPEGLRDVSANLSNANFVEQLYHTVLGRVSDAGGKQGWVDALDSGSLSRVDVSDGFVFSTEHLGQLQPAFSAGVFVADEAESGVARLYHVLLGRDPDGAGLADWGAAAHGGVSLSAIADAFLNSSEYGASHGYQTDTQFIDTLYLTGLGRTADRYSEWAWAGFLSHGTTRAQAAASLLKTSEAQNHWTAQVEQGWHIA